MEYKKGDNVTTELYFDAFQNLAEIEAGNVQHHVYNWNSETGNLSNRKDLVKQLEEDFEYDNLNRLTKATASPIGSGLVLNLLEMNYDPNGNIKDKSDAGDYAYHPTKPNAVTSVSNDNQNINLLTQDISYNALNKASSITEGDYTLGFLYGHDKQRRLTTFYDANGLAMEKYFVGLYEKEIDYQTGITRHINYITAGDGMTAIVLQEEVNGNTIEDTYFTYKDHLGSIVALTDENGDVVLEQSFDECSVTLKFDDVNQSNFLVEPIPMSDQRNREGRYRNPDNWTYLNVEESPTWLRGYTGHSLSRCIFSMFSYEVENSSKITFGEHLPHFDLINMNGRIYDPILGRMLSPDRYVQDPLSSQSYNRYSYVWNNPLRYTDPSGDAVVSIVIGSLITAYIGGSLQSQNWNPFTSQYWEDGWQGFVGGGIVGGFGGWKFALASSKTAFGAKVFAGTMNAMYNYESGQNPLVTLGYFSTVFLGTEIGIGAKSSLAAMVAGGTGNIGVYFTEQVVLSLMTDHEMENIGYGIVQKFVSGALNAYAGHTMLNPSAGYIKGFKNEYLFNNKMLSKGASYTLQNHAATFAYTDKDKYLSMSGRHFLGITGVGFVTGMANYELGQKFDKPFKTKFWNEVHKRSGKFVGGMIATHWDYMANHWLIYGNYYGGPSEYYGYGNKMGIGGTKNMFMWLILGSD